MEYLEKQMQEFFSFVPSFHSSTFAEDTIFVNNATATSHSVFIFGIEKRYFLSYEKNAKSSIIKLVGEPAEAMKFYYMGRSLLFSKYGSTFQYDMIAFLDGFLPDEKIEVDSIYELICIWYFLDVQKQKYGLIMDRSIIKTLSPQHLRYLFLFYDYIETLKWSVYDAEELFHIQEFIMDLIDRNVMKDYFTIFNIPFSDVFDEKLTYFLESRHIRDLSKAVSIGLFRSKRYNKNIYLFGEYHERNEPCNVDDVTKNTYVSDVIEHVLHSKSFFKDFIFENWYPHRIHPANDNDTISSNYTFYASLPKYEPIGTLFHFMKDECLEQREENRFNKKEHLQKKDCRHYRIEYGDARKESISSVNLFQNFYDFIYREWYEKYFTLDYFTDMFSLEMGNWNISPDVFAFLSSPKIKNIVISILNTTSANEISFAALFLDQYFLERVRSICDKSYLKKEILSFMKEKASNIIYGHYHTPQSKYKEVVFKTVNDYDNLAKERHPTFFKTIGQIIVPFLLELNALITDTFILSKFFKKMKHSDIHHGPDEYRNVMCLTGNSHLLIIAEFLTKNHFVCESWSEMDEYTKKIAVEMGINKTCITINHFEQPFFKLKLL